MPTERERTVTGFQTDIGVNWARQGKHGAVVGWRVLPSKQRAVRYHRKPTRSKAFCFFVFRNGKKRKHPVFTLSSIWGKDCYASAQQLHPEHLSTTAGLLKRAHAKERAGHHASCASTAVLQQAV